MRITIVSVGKIKEKYLNDAIKEYSKRLSSYCKLTHVEVSDEKAPETLSDKEEQMIKEKEGQKILAKIKDSQYVFALDLSGKQRTSEEFSAELEKLPVYGNGDIVFVIGGEPWAVEGCHQKEQYSDLLQQDDFSAPADEGDPVGAGLPGYEDYEG